MPDRDLGPATPSLTHEEQAAAVEVCRDVFQGTRHMREQGKKYLPSFPKESEKAYRRRLKRAVLFNAFKRTVKAMVGMVMRKDPELPEELDETVLEHTDNIDTAGRDLPTFGADHFEDAWVDGHSHIFVDMQPSVDADNEFLEEQAGLRPYWIGIKKQDVLRFRSATVRGRMIVTHYAYHEITVEQVGDWQERRVHRVREYFLDDVSSDDEDEPRVGVRFRVWRLDPEKDWPGEGVEDWRLVNPSGAAGDVMSISRIPVATTYTGRTGFLQSDPPFEDLAWLNIRHYQTDSDNENLAHVAKVPLLTFIGISKDKVKEAEVGPSTALVLEGDKTKVDAKWTQADGSDYRDFADDLQKIEQRMAVMGLSMLMSESRAAETAESKRIDKAESDSQLAAAAKNLQATLTEALGLHAEWLDIEDVGDVGVNTDFENEPLDSAVFRELRELWAERGLSWETLMGIAVRGEIMPAGFDLEEERERLDDEAGRQIEAAVGELFGGNGEGGDGGAE